MWVLTFDNFEAGKDQKKLDYPWLGLGSLFIVAAYFHHLLNMNYP